MSRGGAGRPRRSFHRAAALLGAAVLTALLVGPSQARAQYRLQAPSGAEMVLPRDTVLAMLERTRALYDTLEADPRIVYYVGYGRAVPTETPERALPWNAVTVRSDSAVEVVTPGDLREADRAYFNYAVVRMRERAAAGGRDRRGGCSEAVAREARILAAFADGWVVARTLFGSPAYAPLAEIAFAREAGHLEAYAAEHEPGRLEGCGERWGRRHPDGMAAYREWRSTEFLGEAAPVAGGDSLLAR